ncbi:MAG: P-loop NTPase [Chloroflexi bacterium]|nr:P-loop NTPase [Chloroflexota bacterium]
MKQLVILSGKGGTGKTSVTAAFAHLASLAADGPRLVLADADVDAANLELVLAPTILSREDFWGGKVAVIDQDTCIACGECVQVCRFDAIHEEEGLFIIDPIACDGCAACVYQCPSESISMQEQLAGQWFRSDSRFGPLFHANLHPAQENSGKLVTLVKQHARLRALDEGYDLVLVDGPPGIGCPVISATSGADLALIVAEPTVAGVHDMHRVLQTTEHFGVRALVCVNKADLYPSGADEIEAFCRENKIRVAGRIPFDPAVTEAMVQGEAVTAYRPDSLASRALTSIWHTVIEVLEKETS